MYKIKYRKGLVSYKWIPLIENTSGTHTCISFNLCFARLEFCKGTLKRVNYVEYFPSYTTKKTGHSGATLPAFWSKTPI